MKLLKTILLSLVVLALFGFGFVYFGAYNVAADVPHSSPVFKLMQWTRDRSIAVRARDIEVPDLDDPALVAAGAEHYAAMCTGCHLAPGTAESEIRKGLYPKPPNLAEHGTHDPAQAFWVIKHGIKMSAMPAWGTSHDDRAIWGLVAFIGQLPKLDPETYSSLVAGSGGSHSHGEGAHEKPRGDSGHDHAGGDHAATTGRGGSAIAADASEPGAVVERFQEALARADFAAVDAALDPAVTIYESGGVERSRAEYAAGHRGHDAEFLAQAKIDLLAQSGDADGDLAWVASERRIDATIASKPLALASLETMVLRRNAGQWQIVHIHWSSKKLADVPASAAAARGAAARMLVSLSASDVAALARGDGMGFAKAAELNGYPGPRHVLDLADELGLTRNQRASVQRRFDSMRRDARVLGAEYLEALATLESEFATGHIDLPALRAQTIHLGSLWGRLREVHLAAHLATATELTSAQRTRYVTLRNEPL